MFYLWESKLKLVSASTALGRHSQTLSAAIPAAAAQIFRRGRKTHSHNSSTGLCILSREVAYHDMIRNVA